MPYPHLYKSITNYKDSIRVNQKIKKNFFNTLRSAIKDSEFIEILTHTEKDNLDRLENAFRNNESYTTIASNYRPFIDQLENLFPKAYAYISSKSRETPLLKNELAELQDEISNAQNQLKTISKTASAINDATVLTAYAKLFDTDANSHKDNATNWLTYLVVSIIIFIFIIAAVLFIDITEFPIIKNVLADDIRGINYLNILTLSIKAAIIFVYLQIPLFIKRNYFAEKHLEHSNIHRRNVLRSLHAVYNSISDNAEKSKIISIGAAIAFSEPESGYITRKEGAGETNLTETLLREFIK